MRKIIITLEDSDKKFKISGESTIDLINDLYNKHKLNGINQIVCELNKILNVTFHENINLSIPDQLAILPEGKQW